MKKKKFKLYKVEEINNNHNSNNKIGGLINANNILYINF